MQSTQTIVSSRRHLLLRAARSFYEKHSDLIKESHGMVHAEKVHQHACKAIESLMSSSSLFSSTSTAEASSITQTRGSEHTPLPLSPDQALEIEAAALLHDVDDEKYFPKDTNYGSTGSGDDAKTEASYAALYPNAIELMREAEIPASSHETILFMIDVVSCSKNGNSVPHRVDGHHGSTASANSNHDSSSNNNNDNYHLLIPRWSDRIEAVGARGVWRCYQYNQEKKRPLDLPGVTPRPRSAEELWKRHVQPERFEAYMRAADGATEDPSMLGHYYDKLLHVACPPKEIVRNAYLEAKLEDSARELVEVCLRYGRTGVVDEEYIRSFRDA